MLLLPACCVMRVWIGVLKNYTASASGILLCTDVGARGLDIPSIDWVVQYDAPQHVDMFVHRCGRAARAGRAGNAIAFLMPHEDAFIHILKQKNVPTSLMPLPTPPTATLEETAQQSSDSTAGHDATDSSATPVNILPKVRALARDDREIMEKGNAH